jgi:hypothetical protein
VLCGRQEKFAQTKGTDYTCSVCVAKILNTPQDKLKQIQAELIDRGYFDKAAALESFIREVLDGKTERPGSRMVGRRSVRKARAARNQKRS